MQAPSRRGGYPVAGRAVIIRPHLAAPPEAADFPTMFSLQTIFGSGKQFFVLLDEAAVAAHEAAKALYQMMKASDRQPALERLLIEPARRLPLLKFCVAGPQYPDSIAWPSNVERIDHLPPPSTPPSTRRRASR